MKLSKVEVEWPSGKRSIVHEGEAWLDVASKAGVDIPTGCLAGSCGACEIEVDGKIIRACISKISTIDGAILNIEFPSDPYW